MSYKELLPHQQRAVKEKAELDARIEALGDFCNTPIFHGLDQLERAKINRQYLIMEMLAKVLGERITEF